MSYITRHYPHVLITPGLGENQITHCGRLDSKAKGYRIGQPDLELTCKDGDRTDIITIELKFSNVSNSFYIHQEEYIELLHDVNLKTLTFLSYSDLIDFIDEHYKRMRKRPKPIE